MGFEERLASELLPEYMSADEMAFCRDIYFEVKKSNSTSKKVKAFLRKFADSESLDKFIHKFKEEMEGISKAFNINDAPLYRGINHFFVTEKSKACFESIKNLNLNIDRSTNKDSEGAKKRHYHNVSLFKENVSNYKYHLLICHYDKADIAKYFNIIFTAFNECISTDGYAIPEISYEIDQLMDEKSLTKEINNRISHIFSGKLKAEIFFNFGSEIFHKLKHYYNTQYKMCNAFFLHSATFSEVYNASFKTLFETEEKKNEAGNTKDINPVVSSSITGQNSFIQENISPECQPPNISNYGSLMTTACDKTAPVLIESISLPTNNLGKRSGKDEDLQYEPNVEEKRFKRENSQTINHSFSPYFFKLDEECMHIPSGPPYLNRNLLGKFFQGNASKSSLLEVCNGSTSQPIQNYNDQLEANFNKLFGLPDNN